MELSNLASFFYHLVARSTPIGICICVQSAPAILQRGHAACIEVVCRPFGSYVARVVVAAAGDRNHRCPRLRRQLNLLKQVVQFPGSAVVVAVAFAVVSSWWWWWWWWWWRRWRRWSWPRHKPDRYLLGSQANTLDKTINSTFATHPRPVS